MRKNLTKMTYLIVLSLLIIWPGASLSAAENVSKITKEELKAKLDRPDIVIIDVRTGKDWASSEFKIKGAVRANPSEFDSWSGDYPKDKTLILYCA